jgi:hypothetical protein
MREVSLSPPPSAADKEAFLKWVSDSIGQIAAASRIDRAGNQIDEALEVLDDYYTSAEVDALVAVLTGRNLTAGAGLTGGGTLAADRTFDVGAGSGMTINANDVAMSLNSRTCSINFYITGGAAVVTTGNKRGLSIPFACTITSVTVGLDQTGSVVVDIWKDSYANYPPVVGDSITASAKPTISSAVKYTDATLTGWTTSISAGDWLFFNIDSITAATVVSINLTVVKA